MLKIPIAFSPYKQKDKIIFHSQYIDSYGNIITNLHKNLFDKIAEGRISFDFYCTQMGTQKNCRISMDYNDKFGDQCLLLFGHSQYLEICVRYAPFAKILFSQSLNLEFSITFSPQNMWFFMIGFLCELCGWFFFLICPTYCKKTIEAF